MILDYLEARGNSQHPGINRLEIWIVTDADSVLQFLKEDDVPAVEAGELVVGGMDGVEGQVGLVALTAPDRVNSPVVDVAAVCRQFVAHEPDRLDDPSAGHDGC